LLPQARVMVALDEGTTVLKGGFGVVLKLAGAETGGSFSVVEHPLAPGVLGSPPHTHTNEDEYSFVVEGTIGVMLGEEIYEAGPGSYVIKPRGVVHAFWNSGPEPARIVEIIAPAGFERYFEELAEALSAGGRRRCPGSKRSPRGTASPSIGSGWGRSWRGTASTWGNVPGWAQARFCSGSSR
jgi:mannose-6-phosphate isomerase-like protein (cupin superfamily)